jgi:hypothetical protein
MKEFEPPQAWRVMAADSGSGYFVYFDATYEEIGVRMLTAAEKFARLDKLGSVSAVPLDQSSLDDQMDALELDEPKAQLDPQAGFVESMSFYMKGGD